MKKKCNTCPTATLVLWTAVLILCFASPAYTAGGERVLVSLQDGSKVLIFDPAKHAFTGTINIYTPSPLGRALPPNINDILVVDGKVWVTVPGAQVSETGINEMAVIDPAAASLLTMFKVGITPSGLLLHDGKVYVVNRYGNTIEEIDAATSTPLRTIPFSAPQPGTWNPPLFLEVDNGKIYLPFPGGFSRRGFIQILDLETGALLKSIDFAPVSDYGPMAIKRVGRNKVYLGGLNSVTVLNTTTDTITGTIPLSSSPRWVQSFAISGHKVYAANGVSTVSVIDSARDAFIKEVDTGYHDYACHLRTGIAAGADRVYVGDAGRGLKIIDSKTDTLAATLASEEPLGPVAVVTMKNAVR
jgi:DNA-binding beta-propeller fold protein YncE